MKKKIHIYVDESNQTGILKESKKYPNQLNYGNETEKDKHRFFGIGFLILTEDEKNHFLKINGFENDAGIKGNELLSKNNNSILLKKMCLFSNYRNSLFYVFADKLFNLARDFFFYMFGEEVCVKKDYYHEIISILSTELVKDKKSNWELQIINFFDTNEISIDSFLLFWKEYKFLYEKNNLENSNLKIINSIKVFRSFMEKNNFKNNRENEKTNVHINAFCQIIRHIIEKYKIRKNNKNYEIFIHHDSIEWLEKEANIIKNNIKTYLNTININLNINIDFPNSKNNVLIEFIDNFVSVVTGLFVKNINFFLLIEPKKLDSHWLEKEVKDNNKWNYNYMHSLYKNILYNNNNIQLYCSFDLWGTILAILNTCINDINNQFEKNYWKHYNEIYYQNFKTFPIIQ
ncbi:MAG: hypothetical protein ACRCW6_01210 [Mycoplasmoidaceae bacterium]